MERGCVGGRLSTDKTADIIRKCDPCLYKGSANEASTYCGQCEEYMCVSCTSAHKSFKLLRDHVCISVTGRDFPLREECGTCKTKPAQSHCSKHEDTQLSASESTGPVSTSIYKPAQTHGIYIPLFPPYWRESKHVGPPLSTSRSTGPESTSIYKLTESHDSKHVQFVYPPVSASRSTDHESGRKPVSDMEVVMSTVINVTSNNVTGSAVMPDGRIVLADCRNKQIILLDHDFGIQSTLTLPCWPEDVVVYGDNAAVVTLPGMKQLRYIHVDTTLRAGHTIPMTGLDCRGVAVHDREIYVTVADGNGPRVQVLDTRGMVVRTIRRISGYFSCITVGRGGTLYTADLVSGHITCCTNTGDVVYDVEHESISGPTRLLVDDDDNLLVCCGRSNNIHVLGKDGAHRRVILSSADGVVNPYSVSYRRSDQTLIVTMSEQTPSCRAYKLK